MNGDGAVKDVWMKLFVMALVALTIVVIARAVIRNGQELVLIHALTGERLLLIAWQVMALLAAATFVWRVYLAMAYRPAAIVRSNKKLPTVAVIVPAYNEGRQVLDTLRSIAKSNYPVDKMTIIAIDDGSKDDTWSWMLMAAKELGKRVELIRQDRNLGKRHALYAGIRRSKAQVIVTIDSDSEVDRDTLRSIVSPFVHNPQVGGVAGNVRVLNRNEGVIPRMLDVAFCYSFDFMRAGESHINTVMCTPGALSAYRTSAVLPVLDEWLNQKFMGRPANIGEDRAFTNLILRQGYYVHYQSTALVWTKLPTHYSGLRRMLLRWPGPTSGRPSPSAVSLSPTSGKAP